MLHQERHLVGANLKHGAGSLDIVGTVSKAGIEKSGIVNSELSVGGIERNHLGCVFGWNTHSLSGCENIEVSGFEDQIPGRILMADLPEFFRRIKIDLVQFDGRSVALRFVSNDLARVCSLQIDGHS